MLIDSLLFMLVLGRMSSTVASALNSTCKTGALIFLHGLGDTPAGWSSLEQMLPSIKPRLANLKYVFPPAPIIPITINGGAEMPGWFDVLDWPIGLSARDDKKGKLAAVAQIQDEIARLEAEGISRNRIVVGGFSQGGAIALLTAYHRSDDQGPPLAGCASLSGWLTLRDELNVSGNSKQCPLFWGHGKFDDKVLFEQQGHGVQMLQEQGVAVQAKSYPVGHSSHPDEIDAFATFLDSLLYGDEDGSKKE
jgi:lysophospholipase II